MTWTDAKVFARNAARVGWRGACALARASYRAGGFALAKLGKLIGPAETAVKHELCKDEVRAAFSKALASTSGSWTTGKVILSDPDIRLALASIAIGTFIGVLDLIGHYFNGTERDASTSNGATEPPPAPPEDPAP